MINRLIVLWTLNVITNRKNGSVYEKKCHCRITVDCVYNLSVNLPSMELFFLSSYVLYHCMVHPFFFSPFPVVAVTVNTNNEVPHKQINLFPFIQFVRFIYVALSGKCMQSCCGSYCFRSMTLFLHTYTLED